MSKLKTLKDLKRYHRWPGKEFIHEDDLKQEAIKWVKIFKYGTPSGHQFGIMDFASFFNITEEDLVSD